MSSGGFEVLKNIDGQKTVTEVAAYLKIEVDDNKFVDVGRETAELLGVSYERLHAAVKMLKDLGYQQFVIAKRQQGKFEDVAVKIICGPETTQKEVYNLVQKGERI